MVRRVWREDFRIIGYYTGLVTIGVGLLMLVPMMTSLVFREWASALDFAISVALTLLVGYVLALSSRTRSTPGLTHAIVIAAGSWLVAMVLSGVPYMLSGHMKSFLDACFDTMSGFTTTGMFLLQDLDHIAEGLNMWRHLLTYVGGQGIVVLALTFLIGSTGGAFKIMGGEGKDGMWTYLVWAKATHTMAHELSHVVLHVFERCGIDPREAGGEPFCYILSQLLLEASRTIAAQPAISDK
jgi:Trk-type K+ transport system membrane component